LFVLFLLAGFALVVAPPIEPRIIAFTRGIARLSAAIIHSFGGQVRVDQTALTSPVSGFSVEVLNGCNGINATLLLWAAILAYPAGWGQKLKGLLVGGLAIQGINLVRVISLYYLGQFSVRWFQFAHLYVWEMLVMLAGLVTFVLWIRSIPLQRPPADGNA